MVSSSILTKKEVLEIIKTNKVDDPDSQTKLKNLCMNHPKSKEYAFDKVSSIKLNQFKNGFIAVYPNGTEKTWSYIKALSGKDETNAQKAVKAARNEVLCQTRTFRKENGESGNGKTTHVGHVGETEFKDIFKSFVDLISLNVDIVEIEQVKPEEFNVDYKIPMFKNRRIAELWKKYHAKHAKFQIQDAHDNLTYAHRS